MPWIPALLVVHSIFITDYHRFFPSPFFSVTMFITSGLPAFIPFSSIIFLHQFLPSFIFVFSLATANSSMLPCGPVHYDYTHTLARPPIPKHLSIRFLKSVHSVITQRSVKSMMNTLHMYRSRTRRLKSFSSVFFLLDLSHLQSYLLGFHKRNQHYTIITSTAYERCTQGHRAHMFRSSHDTNINRYKH